MRTALIGASTCAALLAAAVRPANARAALAATELSMPVVEVGIDASIGLPIIEAHVNGMGPFRFILDTGSAGSLILDQDLAEQLGLKGRGTAALGDAGHAGNTGATISRVDSVDMGGAVFRNVDVAYLPNALPIHGAHAPRGIIGLSLFADVLLTIDAEQQQLEIKRGELPRANGETIVSYDIPHGAPRIPVGVGSLRVLADLDCGSSGGLTLPAAYADSLELATPPAEIGHGLSINGEFAVRAAVLEGAVKFGGRSWDKPALEFSNASVATLGYRLMRDITITFDPRSHRIQFGP